MNEIEQFATLLANIISARATRIFEEWGPDDDIGCALTCVVNDIREARDMFVNERAALKEQDQ